MLHRHLKADVSVLVSLYSLGICIPVLFETSLESGQLQEPEVSLKQVYPDLSVELHPQPLPALIRCSLIRVGT